MASQSLIIDGNMFKNVQSTIKRETAKLWGEDQSVVIPLGEIREFVLENQSEMFSNGGKAFVVRHFVDQIKQQRSSLTAILPPNNPIIIANNYRENSANTEEAIAPNTQNTGLAKADPPSQSGSLDLNQKSSSLPAEILQEVKEKFAYSQQVQQEVIQHLQDQKVQSAIELREKLNQLSLLEARILTKVLGDFRVQHEENLNQLRATLNQSKQIATEASENFTQEFQRRNREIEMQFGL